MNNKKLIIKVIDSVPFWVLVSMGLLVLLVLSLFSPVMSENGYKKYIIENSDKIEQSETWEGDSNFFRINATNLNYFEEVTIKVDEDDGEYEGYNIIFWGDRKSWLWYFKKDKSISCDIPYFEYKEIDTELDKKILELCLNVRNGK